MVGGILLELGQGRTYGVRVLAGPSGAGFVL
jgi:hypothetical protein